MPRRPCKCVNQKKNFYDVGKKSQKSPVAIKIDCHTDSVQAHEDGPPFNWNTILCQIGNQTKRKKTIYIHFPIHSFTHLDIETCFKKIPYSRLVRAPIE